MYEQKEESKESKSTIASNSIVQKKGNRKRGFSLEDNRQKNSLLGGSQGIENGTNSLNNSTKSTSHLFQLARSKKLSANAQANRDGLLKKRKDKFDKIEALRKKKAAELAKHQGEHKSKMIGMLGSELSPKITERSIRSDNYLKTKSGEIGALTGDKRPNKPEGLTKKDDKLGNLTAHHLFPYNKIREEFATSLKDKDIGAVQNVMSFSGKGKTDSSEAFRLLAYQKEHTPSAKWKAHQKVVRDEQKVREGKRKGPAKGVLPPVTLDPTPDSSSKRLDGAFRDATWAEHNIFMGPEPKKRTDDPHEGLDVKFDSKGKPSKSSVLAQELDKKGFKGVEPVAFHSKLQTARNESKGTRPYKSEEWNEKGGMHSQKGRSVYHKKHAEEIKRLSAQKSNFEAQILKMSKGMTKGQKTNVRLTNRGLKAKIASINEKIGAARKESTMYDT